MHKAYIEKDDMSTTQTILKLFLVFILCIGMLACSSGSTPPGPGIAAGVYIDSAYEFFNWEDGLKVMIWHDAIRSSSCNSSGSTTDPVHIVNCEAFSPTGQRFDWQIETVDGLTAEFHINGERYDLSDGNIFLVSTANEMTHIQQTRGDLSNLSLEYDDIVSYGLGHTDIEQFMQLTSRE